MKLFRLIPYVLILSQSALGDECGVMISHYRNASVWEDSRVRIIIEADTACSGRPGQFLDLKNVQLTIESGLRRIARLKARDGILSQKQKKFMMSEFTSIEGKIPPAQTLLVDLSNHSIRSAGVYLDLKEYF